MALEFSTAQEYFKKLENKQITLKKIDRQLVNLVREYLNNANVKLRTALKNHIEKNFTHSIVSVDLKTNQKEQTISKIYLIRILGYDSRLKDTHVSEQYIQIDLVSTEDSNNVNSQLKVLLSSIYIDELLLRTPLDQIKDLQYDFIANQLEDDLLIEYIDIDEELD